MNKNQSRIRKFAAENNGQCQNVRKDYDKGCNDGRPQSVFVSREIPIGFQPRKSEKNCPKVARKGCNKS